MSGEVVAFPRQCLDRMIWRCPCGCISFSLRADGVAECANCNRVMDGLGEWRERLPEPTANAPAPSGDDVVVTKMSETGASLSRVLAKASHEGTAAVILLQIDGMVSTWGVPMSADQLEWFDGRIASARKMLTDPEG